MRWPEFRALVSGFLAADTRIWRVLNPPDKDKSGGEPS